MTPRSRTDALAKLLKYQPRRKVAGIIVGLESKKLRARITRRANAILALASPRQPPKQHPRRGKAGAHQ